MYKKTIWKDEIVDVNGEVLQSGTPLSAKNLNKIEDEVEKNSSAIDNLEINVESNSKDISNMKDSITQNKPIVITDDMPVGTLIWWSSDKVRDKLDSDIWKVANGQVLQKVDYPELYELYSGNPNYTVSSAEFALPNLLYNRRFIRSVGDDYNVGAIADDAIKSHRHNLVSNSGKAIVHSTKHSESGVNDNAYDTYLYDNVRANHRPTTEPWFFSSYTDHVGESETRPKNMSLVPLIKCKSITKNMKDVAQEWTAFKETGNLDSFILQLKEPLDGVSEPEIIVRGKELKRGFYANEDKMGFYDWKTNRSIFTVSERDNAGVLNKDKFYFGDYKDTTDGYCALPNGMKMQWGVYNHSYSVGHTGFTGFRISYPKAFSTKCVSLQLTPMLNEHDVDKVTHMHIENTNTGELRLDYADVKYHLKSAGAFTTKVYWFAIGF